MAGILKKINTVGGLAPGTARFKLPPETNKPSQAQINCELKGGRWDALKGLCVMPEKPKLNLPKEPTTPLEAQKTSPTPQPGEVINDAETGEPKGFINSKGEFVSARREDIQNVVSKETARLAPIEGGRVFSERVQQEAIEAERQRLRSEELPQRRELDPALNPSESIPVVGPILSKIRKALGLSAQSNSLKDILTGNAAEVDFIELTPDELRTVALSEIERQEIERGLTANEEFGAFVEAIPLIGSLATKFAGGLIETPSENAREVKSNVLKEKRRISNIETNVKLGYLPVEVANEQIIDIENNIQRLESRIRLLIANSPELKFNSDYVNTVETEILATREKAFQAKANILTGASKDPNEIQLLQQLQLSAGNADL